MDILPKNVCQIKHMGGYRYLRLKISPVESFSEYQNF
jgi:hypothetical protein